MRTPVFVPYFDGKAHQEIFGLSTETKPTDGVAMGSSFTEVNTGKIYLFNEVSGQWVEQTAIALQS